MILVRIAHGLGNQMFQYAFGRALSWKRNVPLRLEVSSFLHDPKRAYALHQFNTLEQYPSQEEIDSVITRPLTTELPWWNQPIVNEPHFHYSADIIKVPSTGYFVGYWQSEQYFSEIADLIKLEMSPKLPLSGLNLDVARQICSGTSISLHVRRGDYVTDQGISTFHGTCTLDYYRNAIAFIGERVANPRFFLFSDDPEWVKANLEIKFPVLMVDHNQSNPIEDLRLMSLCRHHIIANSTFSWWGAWLAERPGQIVCAPNRWFGASAHDTRDLIPDRWVRLDG